ncbi:hypothetical protein DFP72DRAFT_1083238 [Ephemerocybe angulata]|uniref:Uncharacterized protein n=1 Tax=Ephemerocybe angulata TaxID=980116 RepID=A0A8H6LUW1_9AGAR|nr:hypothetical protein DFP72DRAFT_1083238 [Tulosesus angulatus]
MPVHSESQITADAITRTGYELALLLNIIENIKKRYANGVPDADRLYNHLDLLCPSTQQNDGNGAAMTMSAIINMILTPATGSSILSALIDDNEPVKYWHVVAVGRQPGVFHGTLSDIQPNVEGLPEPSITSYVEEGPANAAYLKALQNGRVEEIVLEHRRRVLVDIKHVFAD